MPEFAAATHPGLKRGNNEDCYEADPTLGLWLVADGVGGHASGEVASAIVRQTIKSSFAEGLPLLDCVHRAHQAVLAEIAGSSVDTNMGSTIVALAMEDNNYTLVWVGDSRAYLWNGKVLTQLTQDHSQIAMLLEQGVIHYKEARTHPERHMLTQSMGISADMSISPGLLQGRLASGNQILLCSDGLTDELEDRDIVAHLSDNNSLQSRVDALLQAALDAGGRDNVTVVLVDSCPATKDVDLETTQNTSRIDGLRRTDSGWQRWETWVFVVAVIVAAVWTLLS